MRKTQAHPNRNNSACRKGGLRLRSFPSLAVLIGLGLGVLLLMEATVLFPWRADADTTATLTQNAFRFYVDNDAVQPADAWPAGATDLAENAAITTADAPPDDNTLIRIRMSLGITGDTMAAASQAFKLQYGEGTDCAAIVSWSDVGAAGSATIWRGESDATPADGTTISSALLSTAGTLQSYEEQNNSALNPNEATAGQSAEWDWLVQNYGALHDTTYCFRMVKSDGTALSAYTNYPKIQSEATVFDSSFEGGNGTNFTKPYGGSAAAISYESELDGVGTNPICDDAQKQNWFYFSITNAQYQSFSMKFINADANSNQTSWWTEFRPVYSYDQVTWTRVAVTGALNGVDYDYTVPGGGATFTSDTVYIAFTLPYTYSDYTADLAEWDASDLVSYVDIGDSVQGREMDLVTVADTSSPIAAADKKVYWIIGRQHSTETAGSISIDEVIRFLIGGSDEAKLMLRSSIFKIIPMMNPDGAYNGWTRTNAQRCDINREWESTGANAATETAEIFNAHTAIESWMTSGTPNTVDVFSDYHHLTSSEMSLVYVGDAAMVGASDNPYEKIFGWLDPNTHTSNFTASGTVGLFNVAIYDQYNATKGSLSFTVEHAGIKFSNGWPTNENIRAYGLAWLKTMFSVNESNAKIFGMEPPDGGTGTDSRFYVVTSPGQMTLSFDEDAGGGMTHWFNLENDPNMLQELAEATLRNIDEVSWHDGTDWRLTSTTPNATLAVISNSGNRLRFKYTGVWEAVSGYDYEHERVMWGNGISWQSFKFTNNTAGSINWGNMYMQASVENLLAASFAFDYDNTADPPTPGTDNWFGIVGNGTAGIKAVVMAYPYGQTGGWVYNDYLSASSLSGHRNEYFIIDGPAQGTGAGNAITTYVAYQVGSDNDVIGSEVQIDEYSNYIQSPDTPTMTTGTFSSFDKQEGSLSFGAATNHVVFTYTNADTVTKKSPSYVITDYTASTAPVLNVNGAYLDGEDGSAHSGTTHVSASYTASVDTTNDIAYVQYLGDISANQVVMLGYELSYTLTYTAGANGSITGTTPQTVNYGADGTEVTAVPDVNYHFTSWSDGVLTAARTDTNVTGDITVTASFAINTYILTYTAGANGSITGTTPQTVNYGEDGTEVTAVPDVNYHFISWSDGVLTTARTDTNVTANVTVTANFAIDTFTLTYTAGAHGSITGTSPQTINYGADGTEVTAVPATGYHFTSWSDGVLTAARTDTNVTANVTVTANFAFDAFTLSYAAGAHGLISGTTPQTINYGADGSEVIAVSSANYHFTSWSDGVLTAARTDENVTANITVTASFAINTYTLTYTAGANGSITGTSPQTVNYGADGSEMTAVPSDDYHFVDWSDASTDNPRTDTNVTNDVSVTANFAADTQITDVAETNITTSAATVTWTTNQAATSTVDYGKTTIYGNTETDSTETTEHEMRLTDLRSNTTYHYRVVSVGNTTATSVDGTFTTAAETEPEVDRPPAPTIMNPIDQATLITTQPTVTGFAKSGQTILVYVDSGYIGETEASQHTSGTGSFGYTPAQDLELGWHTLYAKAEDENGIKSKPSKMIQFKIEAPYIPPTILDSDVNNGTSPTITVTGLAHNDSIIQVLIDGVVVDEFSVTNHPSGTTSFHYEITTDSDLGTGNHLLTLIARDRNGKPSLPTEPLAFIKTEVSVLPRPGLMPNLSNPVTYIVAVGDSLWKIARRFTGFGVHFNDIVWVNRDNYPMLLTNPSFLIPGWSLLIPF